MSNLDGWTWIRKTPSGFIAHKMVDGEPQPFWAVKLPTGWFAIVVRLLHRCKTWSVGVFGWEVTERCPCGAVRFSQLDPIVYMRGSTPAGVEYKPGPWQDRNTRFTGDAVVYQGGIRPLAGTEGGV